jgi:RNA-binding motif X-linked protein 2
VITIFSQFGEPTYINLVRDKETGKSKGFAFLKYEDQRSTDLAVDNLGGAVIMDRTLKVDHTRYKKKDDEPDGGQHLDEAAMQLEDVDGEGRRKRRRTSESESEEERRPMLKEERELAKLIQEHDEDDPMKAYLIQEKKEEVALALAKVTGKPSEKGRKHRHHHHRSHKSKEDEGEESSRRSRHRRDEHTRHRSRERSERDGEKPRERAYEPERSEHRSRRRSPRRDDDEGGRNERRRKDHFLDDSRHRSRRDSRG